VHVHGELKSDHRDNIRLYSRRLFYQIVNSLNHGIAIRNTQKPVRLQNIEILGSNRDGILFHTHSNVTVVDSYFANSSSSYAGSYYHLRSYYGSGSMNILSRCVMPVGDLLTDSSCDQPAQISTSSSSFHLFAQHVYGQRLSRCLRISRSRIGLEYRPV